MAEGEHQAFKKSLGMGENKEDRESTGQGQDFWGMKEDGRSRTGSFR